MFASIVDDVISNLPRGTTGWITLALIAGGFVAAAILLRRVLPGRRVIRYSLLAVPAASVLWWLGSPLFIDERVNEDFPTVAAAAGPTPTAVATEPARLATGRLDGIGHRAMGGVSVYRLADGRHFVRLEEIDVQNGPDLYVYLAPDPDQESEDGVVNLGKLKGNQGSQNYEVPVGVDLDEFQTVLIWCRRFAVPFANATLGRE